MPSQIIALEAKIKQAEWEKREQERIEIDRENQCINDALYGFDVCAIGYYVNPNSR
jgi:hypothetical protein